jgi:hypothetical protein
MLFVCYTVLRQLYVANTVLVQRNDGGEKLEVETALARQRRAVQGTDGARACPVCC